MVKHVSLGFLPVFSKPYAFINLIFFGTSSGQHCVLFMALLGQFYLISQEMPLWYFLLHQWFISVALSLYFQSWIQHMSPSFQLASITTLLKQLKLGVITQDERDKAPGVQRLFMCTCKPCRDLLQQLKLKILPETFRESRIQDLAHFAMKRY